MIEGTPLQAALLAALPQAWVEALPLWLLNAQLSLRDALAALCVARGGWKAAAACGVLFG